MVASGPEKKGEGGDAGECPAGILSRWLEMGLWHLEEAL